MKWRDPQARKAVNRLLFKLTVCIVVAQFDGRPFLLGLSSWIALAGFITAVFAGLGRERFQMGAYNQWSEVSCLIVLSFLSTLLHDTLVA